MNIKTKKDYEYNIGNSLSPSFFHIDYGVRHYEINMNFQHFHSFYEIYTLLNGNSNHIIEGQLYPLKPYDIVVLKPYILHKTQYIKNQPSERLVMNFSLDYMKTQLIGEMNNTFLNKSYTIYRFEEKPKERLINLLNTLYSATILDSEVKNLKIYSIFLELLFDLKNNKNIYDTKNINENNKLSMVTTYIHENYHLPLSLETLSKMFFISPHYLCHQFKKATGFTITQYIHLTRIKKAEQLLIETKMKQMEICEKCGFGSLSQFNRVFKHLCDKSPSQFRKNDNL